MKKIMHIARFLFLCMVMLFEFRMVMAQDNTYPEFYTDKNRYFSFIPPTGWTRAEEFPDDPRSKVAFTYHDNDSDLDVALVFIVTQVDKPRTLKSLTKFLEDRLRIVRKQTGAITTSVEPVMLGETQCVSTEVFLDTTKTKIFLGYPYDTLCLDITYTAPVGVYDVYLPAVQESIATFIPLKGAFIKDEDIVAAQNRIWLQKEAVLLLSDQKYRQALELLEPIVKERENDSNMQFQLGLAYRGLNMSSKAIERFSKATEINPLFWEAYFQLGVVYLHNKNYLKAEDTFTAALNINPESYKVALNLATAYRLVGKAKKAVALYKTLLDRNSTDVSVWFNMGRAYLDMRKVRKAQNSFEQALVYEPNHLASLVNLAACRFTVKQFDDARSLCKKAVFLDPNCVQAKKLLEEIDKMSPQ